MPKFRIKKPIIVEAEQFTPGDGVQQGDTFDAFNRRWVIVVDEGGVGPMIEVATQHGTVIATWGDWIVKGVTGEFFAVTNDVFQATYEGETDENRTAIASDVDSPESPGQGQSSLPPRS